MKFSTSRHVDQKERFHMLLERTEGKRVSLYFNLTNACNSACIFCASSSQNVKSRRYVSLSHVLKAVDHFRLGNGDEVIFNGGEPTICRGLVQMISYAAQREAKVTLFTNGRLLRNSDFAKNVLEAGVFRLSIPLHGRYAETHDRLTGRSGNFAETLSGIHNAYLIQSQSGYPCEIELKLLAAREALPEWPAIVDMIAQDFGNPSTLVLSGLHMWSTAVPDYQNGIAPTLDEMRTFVNEALGRITVHGMKPVLWSIPLCLLTTEHQQAFLRSSYPASSMLSCDVQNLYFDPDIPEGILLGNDEAQINPDSNAPCRKCLLVEFCGPGSTFMEQILKLVS